MKVEELLNIIKNNTYVYLKNDRQYFDEGLPEDLLAKYCFDEIKVISIEAEEDAIYIEF